MAPHMQKQELDLLFAMAAARATAVDIHAALAQRRAAAGLPVPDLTTVRRVLKGKAHTRGGLEHRGRKRKLSQRAVVRLNEARKELIARAAGEREVHVRHIVKKTGVAPVHVSTVLRDLRDAGYDVKRRVPRQKPLRTAEHAA